MNKELEFSFAEVLVAWKDLLHHGVEVEEESMQSSRFSQLIDHAQKPRALVRDLKMEIAIRFPVFVFEPFPRLGDNKNEYAAWSESTVELDKKSLCSIRNRHDFQS